MAAGNPVFLVVARLKCGDQETFFFRSRTRAEKTMELFKVAPGVEVCAMARMRRADAQPTR